MQSALVATVTAAYRDFGALGLGALAMIAARRGVAVGDAERHALAEGLRQLPPHPDTCRKASGTCAMPACASPR